MQLCLRFPARHEKDEPSALLLVRGAAGEGSARSEQEMRGTVSAGGEDVGEARSWSTVTFNEQGDYVLAAVCRLETKDLVRDNYLSLELRDFFSLLAGKEVLGSAQHPDLQPQEGRAVVSLSPTPAKEESCPQRMGLGYNPGIKPMS